MGDRRPEALRSPAVGAQRQRGEGARRESCHSSWSEEDQTATTQADKETGAHEGATWSTSSHRSGEPRESPQHSEQWPPQWKPVGSRKCALEKAPQAGLFDL